LLQQPIECPSEDQADPSVERVDHGLLRGRGNLTWASEHRAYPPCARRKRRLNRTLLWFESRVQGYRPNSLILSVRIRLKTRSARNLVVDFFGC
jgi:hypothetical protein